MLQANNINELALALGKIDISVPKRSDGRKSEHTERYTIVNLLRSMRCNEVDFPLSLSHRDKPDFLLTMSASEVGIEHTEAVPQNEAQAMRLHEEGHGKDTYLISHRSPSEKRINRRQLIKNIEENTETDGWAGDAPEKEWAAAMVCSAEKKIQAIRKPGFDRFSENWLLIYDNWPLPSVDLIRSSKLLQQSLARGEAFQEFNVVFVINEHSLCKITSVECDVRDVIKPS